MADDRMSYSLHLITPPTDDVVSLELVKKHLKQTTSDNDDLIRAMIDAAVAQFDAPGGAWLGMALRPQTWELRTDYFPYWGTEGHYGLALPYPPLISVDSVVYDNDDGIEIALVEGTSYRVFNLGGRSKSYIAPVYNGSWPSAMRGDINSVRVRFTAGHRLTTPDSLPAPIKQAVLLAVRDLWSLGERNLYLRSESAPGLASYEWTVSETAGKVIRSAVENLLSSYRVYD
jgi:uncharacterized phiE125 gp8 family phage protein